MRYHVRHVTRHAYSHPVFLEPHTLRFHPRSDGGQQIHRFSMRIDPEPDGISHQLDPEGNIVTEAWFGSLTEQLEVISEFEVEMLRSNPFDYLLHSSSGTLPLGYEATLKERLSPYLAGPTTHASVEELAHSALEEANGQTLLFLTLLTDRIHKSCRQIIREEGAAWEPEETLARGEGSCRDMTVLAMAACREVGIAARFVSGYQEGDPTQAKRYMHAWVEAYLPGGGWRGYDPTLNLAVADRHIPVAASYFPAEAAPISGTFRGTDVSSRIEIEISLETHAL